MRNRDDDELDVDPGDKAEIALAPDAIPPPFRCCMHFMIYLEATGGSRFIRDLRTSYALVTVFGTDTNLMSISLPIKFFIRPRFCSVNNSLSI
jgi:hypothetical protein